MEKTLTEAAQLLQKISKGAAMRRDWENDVRQALRKNLKCGCLLEFSEKRHRK